MQKNPLFDESEVTNFNKNLLLKIPDDIKKDIYIQYFEPIIDAQELCNLLLNELKSEKCIKLDISDLFPLLKKVLDNKYSIEYLYNNYYYYDEYTKKENNYFKQLYNFYKNNGKNFILIKDPIEDFALSWLMYLYH